MAASGVAELGAEALAARISYGEGALVACDQVVRIYTGDGAARGQRATRR